MEENSFIKQMSSMKEKSDKYDNLLKRYDKLAEDLTEISESIQKIVSDIRPHSSKIREKSKGIQDVLEFSIRWMDAGQYLTMDILEKEFPDRTKGSISQIFYMEIPKLKNILATKINGKKNYYLNKNN